MITTDPITFIYHTVLYSIMNLISGYINSGIALIKEWIYSRLFYTATVDNEKCPNFRKIFHAYKIAKVLDTDSYSVTEQSSSALGDKFRVKYNNRIIWCSITEKLHADKRIHYTATISCWIWNKKTLLDFIFKIFSQKNDIVYSHYSHYGYFKEYNTINSHLEPILPVTILSSLFSDIDFFLNAKEWYEGKNIPYRKGYIFYGLPGTGKTTLIRYTATKYKLPIYIFNKETFLNDSCLKMIIQVVPPAIIVMEDIDVMFETSKNSHKYNISLSDVLNAIDGISSQKGNIVIMTTNHIEKLAPSLIRSGRVDMKIKFTHAREPEIKRAFLRFFPDEELEAEKYYESVKEKKMVMADVEKELLYIQNLRKNMNKK